MAERAQRGVDLRENPVFYGKLGPGGQAPPAHLGSSGRQARGWAYDRSASRWDYPSEGRLVSFPARGLNVVPLRGTRMKLVAPTSRTADTTFNSLLPARYFHGKLPVTSPRTPSGEQSPDFHARLVQTRLLLSEAAGQRWAGVS